MVNFSVLPPEINSGRMFFGAGSGPMLAAAAAWDGLAPAWIGVGTHDLLHDEDLAYAERLTAAGVPCQVEVVEGAFHGFDRVAPNVGVSQRFFTSQCNSLRAALALSNRT